MKNPCEISKFSLTVRSPILHLASTVRHPNPPRWMSPGADVALPRGGSFLILNEFVFLPYSKFLMGMEN